jgi:glycosyltransferase involved in cell wall biosynthesis
MSARVSAIIATYNYGRFLPRAIDSVLAQTYPHIECVVTDDGSTDETQDVLKRYAGRVRVLQQPHGGVSAARNTAIDASRGDYVAFLDGDDWWHPTKIEKQVALLEQRPELGCVGCGLEHVTPDGHVDRIAGRPNHDTQMQTLRNIAVRRFWIQGSCSGAVIRRSLLERIGPFDQTLAAAEDWDMWLRVASVANVDNLPEVLVSIDRHGTGVFRDGRLVEDSQWRVYRYAAARWPHVLTAADQRQMRAMILGDRARESRQYADALAYCLRSLKEWPFNRRRLREAVVLGVRTSINRLSKAGS